MKLIKLLPLLLSIFLFVYILGIDHTISFITYLYLLFRKFEYVIYYIMFAGLLFLLIHFVLSLYILHIYCVKRDKGENIYISKTLPDFVIKYLEDLKFFSESDIVIKEIKRMYYIQIVISSIAAIIWILIFFYLVM